MNTTVVYYKCCCVCRVGIPIEYGYSVPDDSSLGQIFGEPNNILEVFYCNHCKQEMPHIYCGYRTVEK